MKQFKLFWFVILGLCLSVGCTNTEGTSQKTVSSDSSDSEQVKNESTKIRYRFSEDREMLVFESQAEYESAIIAENEKNLEVLLRDLDRLKFKNYFSTRIVTEDSYQRLKETDMDSILGKLLSRDGTIQIGEHIFKIDIGKEKVYVIDVKDKAELYFDLVNGNTKNSKITEYSTDDDVLALLNGEASMKCSGIGGGTYYAYTYAYTSHIVNSFIDGSVWRIDPAVGYFKSGIYFKLSSSYQVIKYANANATTGKRLNKLPPGHKIEMFVRHPKGWYKSKPCGNPSIGGLNGGFYYASTLTYNEATFYSGTRNLNGFYFYVQGRLTISDSNATNWGIASLYAGRNINSPY